MVISKLIEISCDMLKKEGIQSYVLDTHLLLCMFLGVDRPYLITHGDREVENTDGFFNLVKRRAKHEPLQYITGRCEFMSLEFFVTPKVLIPRPDTETLVQRVIEYAGERPLTVLEIGTGSGCISVSLAHYCKNLIIDAVDISKEALDIARQNADHNGVSRINFTKMDIMRDFPNKIYDIVVSNPPYIENGKIPDLMPEVRDYEPPTALDGGDDGLAFYRRIAEGCTHFGYIALEVGMGQSQDVVNILKKNGYKDIRTFCDLSGIERVVSAKGGV
ncbi:MAG: Release factor glutamine methyltransferase [Firmicutes bacterium ADurb.Bin193]|nr:MAG: Release factor glutamine methyltransferase [Firmicutes bacterium ADurb.Bin193]